MNGVNAFRARAMAAATAVYAGAYEQNPRFYGFVRTLEAYDDILTPETLLGVAGGCGHVSVVEWAAIARIESSTVSGWTDSRPL